MKADGNNERRTAEPTGASLQPLFYTTGSYSHLAGKHHKPNDQSLPSPGFPLCSRACASQRSQIIKISKLSLLLALGSQTSKHSRGWILKCSHGRLGKIANT